MDINMHTDKQEWTPQNPNMSSNNSNSNTLHPPPSSSPQRLPATPPSVNHLGHSYPSSSSSSYRLGGPFSQHPQLTPFNQRHLPPPLSIQPYSTPPNRQNPPALPPIHHHPQVHPHYHPPPPNAPPTPGETLWDLRQIDVYRLD